MVTVPDEFAPRRGDDWSLAIPVPNDDGTFVDLTGAQVRFTYGLSADGPPLKVKVNGSGAAIGTVKLNDADVPAILIAMAGDETMALQAYRSYAFQCRVKFSDAQGGVTETVLSGAFSVQPTQ